MHDSGIAFVYTACRFCVAGRNWWNDYVSELEKQGLMKFVSYILISTEKGSLPVVLDIVGEFLDFLDR